MTQPAETSVRLIRLRDLGGLDASTRARMADHVDAEHAGWHRRGTGFNFPLHQDVDGLFARLYLRFLDACLHSIGPFDLRADNDVTCWAYRSTAGSRPDVVHSHESTAHINGVFYLRVPASGDPAAGGLTLFDAGGTATHILPEEGELVIFDGRIPHLPGRIDSDRSRISINMEILVDDPEPIRRRLARVLTAADQQVSADAGSAPSYRLLDQNGRSVDSHAVAGSWWLLHEVATVTDGDCAALATGLADQIESFQDLRCVVIGTSGGSHIANQQFAHRHALPFALLSDPFERSRPPTVSAPSSAIVPSAPFGDHSYLLDPDGQVVTSYRHDDPAFFAERILDDLERLTGDRTAHSDGDGPA